jgi:Fe-S-cluster formation regulator IscX/YfhJ
MAELNSDGINCCGIKEIDVITGQSPEHILEDICQEWFDDTQRAFLIFSVTGKCVSAKNLANYIKENKLGKTYKMKPKMNPNTHNTINMYCWAVNNPGFKSLGIKRGWYSKRSREDEW